MGAAIVLVSTDLRHVEREHEPSVRADVDVAPQPHVVVLPLHAVEAELAEVAQLERRVLLALGNNLVFREYK